VEWRKCRRSNPGAVDALRHYLHADVRQSRVPTVLSLAAMRDQAVAWKEQGGVKAVVFVDADNFVEAMDWLRWLSPCDGDWGVRVVVTMRRGHYSHRMSGIDLRPWVAVCESCEATKDAADFAITLQMGVLCSVLAVPFILLSHDHFGAEIQGQMASMKQECFCVCSTAEIFQLLSDVDVAAWKLHEIAAVMKSLVHHAPWLDRSHARYVASEIVKSTKRCVFPLKFVDVFIDFFSSEERKGRADETAKLVVNGTILSALRAQLPSDEEVDYIVPKSDISLYENDEKRAERELDVFRQCRQGFKVCCKEVHKVWTIGFVKKMLGLLPRLVMPFQREFIVYGFLRDLGKEIGDGDAPVGWKQARVELQQERKHLFALIKQRRVRQLKQGEAVKDDDQLLQELRACREKWIQDCIDRDDFAEPMEVLVNLVRNRGTRDNMETVGVLIETVLDEVIRQVISDGELESFDPVEHIFREHCSIKYIDDF
jgi:hypothetical protein